MPLLKLHKTVGVKVGQVQVGGGAPIVVQSMTMTDTADVRATAAQSIELAAAGSEMVRVTVNLPEAAAAVPEIKQRMLDAGCTVPLIGDFHYNGHLLLTRFPACARALDKYRINPGQRRDRHAPRRAVRDHLQGRGRLQGKPVRIGVNGGSLNQELVTAKMQENTDRNLGRTSEEIINECMVLSAVAVDRAGDRERSAQGPDHHLVQDLAAARPDRRLPRAGPAHRSAAAPRVDRSRHGPQGPGLVGLGDGRAARRRHRRHRARLVDAEAGRRPARRSLRRLRAAPGPGPARVLAQRHRLSWLRADDQLHVSGARRTHSGLHSRKDAGMENASTPASNR